MAYPQTFDEMKSAGYRFDNHARCRGCGQEIEWWITPRGKKLPMNLMAESGSPAVAHFSTCVEAPLFRKVQP